MKRLAARWIAPLYNPYRHFLSLPDVKATLLVAFISRMPVGMMGLSMVMFLREAYGSFKIAGTVMGVYFFSMAVAAPAVGRIIDRIGPRTPLLITAIVEPVAFGLLIAAVWWGWPLPSVFVFAALIGIFSPPITVLTRTLWRHRFAEDRDRKMAFAVDSVLMELNFTIGPAVIGTVLAFSNPRVAILTTWALVTVSIIAFFQSPLLRYWVQEPPSERHLLGPLTNPRLLLLFVIVFGLTTACGLMEVGYPAYATFLATPAFAGALMAINSFGSAVGGAIYGGLHIRHPIEKQFAALLGIFGAVLLLHWPVDNNIVFAVVAFFAGFAIAPSFAAQALMVSRLAPAKYATEAFTWSSTFIVCGLGAGMASAGALAEIVTPKAPFIVAGCLMLSMGALALLLREHSAMPGRQPE